MHPVFVKVSLLKNSTCLLTNFKRYRYYFLHDIETIGRSYIEMNVYTPSFNNSVDQELYFTFDIHPNETKTKQFKLILNNFDLETYFNKTPKYEFNSHYLIGIARSVLSQFRFHRQNVSKQLKLCILHPEYKSHNNRPHVLQNNLNPNNFDNNVKVSHFLEAKYYEPKIILQKVKKHNKTFLIFTIEYLQPFQIWNIRIYNPKTSRTFTASLTFNHLLQWTIRFYEKAYPYYMDEIDLIKVKDYLFYCKEYKRKSFKRRNVAAILNRHGQHIYQRFITEGADQNITTEQKLMLYRLDRMHSTPFLGNIDEPEEDSRYAHDDVLLRRAKQQGITGPQYRTGSYHQHSSSRRNPKSTNRSMYPHKRLISNEIHKEMDFHEIKVPRSYSVYLLCA